MEIFAGKRFLEDVAHLLGRAWEFRRLASQEQASIDDAGMCRRGGGLLPRRPQSALETVGGIRQPAGALGQAHLPELVGRRAQPTITHSLPALGCGRRTIHRPQKHVAITTGTVPPYQRIDEPGFGLRVDAAGFDNPLEVDESAHGYELGELLVCLCIDGLGALGHIHDASTVVNAMLEGIVEPRLQRQQPSR